jgi:hypothetical protein
MGADAAARPPLAAVFGSSEAGPEDLLYRDALRLARLLAGRGWGVVTGGYGGVMEAANRGAYEAGALSVGITTHAFDVFPERRPNRWLSEHRVHDTLLRRTGDLLETASAYAVFHGGAGTLAEAALLWAHQRAGILGGKPIVLMGRMWENVLRALGEAALLSANETDVCRVAGTVEEAAEHLTRGLPIR